MSIDGSAAPGVGLPRRGFDDLPGLQGEGDGMLRGAGDEPAPGPSGDAGSVLARAAALRFPRLSESDSNRERIDALIEHINETAIARGELEELRLEANTNLYVARQELAGIPAVRGKSKAATDDARRTARPDLGDRIDGARWLVDRCTEQINRLGGTDYDAASRTYTLLSGS